MVEIFGLVLEEFIESGAVMNEVDVIVVGAGFGGLRSLYALRKLGKVVQVLEASDDVGGVWYHNGYPGARCDVESYDYSYSFSSELEQEWVWSERYATQPEILRYIRHVVDRFDLRKHIRFGCRMERAEYDTSAACWKVWCGDGSQWTARHLVMAMGQLSAPKTPNYPGQSAFRGQIIHSAVWPKEPVEFSGKRVHAVAGIGNPARFFATLADLGIPCEHHAFADHYPFSPQDFAFVKNDVVVMTEKDAIKCQHFARDNWFVLRVEARCSPELADVVEKRLKDR